MALEKQGQLVQALLRQTRAGKLDWKPTAIDDAFQMSFKNYSVLIAPIKKFNSVDYQISLVNAEGVVAEAFTDTDLSSRLGEPAGGGTWFSRMNDLFELARGTALGSEKLLNEILKELDDDVPF